MTTPPVTLTEFAEATIDDVLAVHDSIRQKNLIATSEAVAIMTHTVVQAIAAAGEHVTVEAKRRS